LLCDKNKNVAQQCEVDGVPPLPVCEPLRCVRKIQSWRYALGIKIQRESDYVDIPCALPVTKKTAFDTVCVSNVQILHIAQMYGNFSTLTGGKFSALFLNDYILTLTVSIRPGADTRFFGRASGISQRAAIQRLKHRRSFVASECFDLLYRASAGVLQIKATANNKILKQFIDFHIHLEN
jgi:hypothetical protein